MAVLVEGISVVVRVDALIAAFQGDWEAFNETVPNGTLCADSELVRVGFMSPRDAEVYVLQLSEHGLIYLDLDAGVAKDMVVVDQLQGPMARCEWIEFGHVNFDGDPAKRVAACRLKGSGLAKVLTPEGWMFDNSLSASFGFVPTMHAEKSMTFLRHEGGLDVYRNEMTGEEMFVGRTNQEK